MSAQSKKVRVAVVFGGRSSEHEISILSARFVVASLDRNRFEPVLVGIDKEGHWRLEDEAFLLSQARDPRLVRLNAAAPSARLSVEHTELTSAREAPRAELAIHGETSPRAIDVVFPVLHGPMGEDGTIQGFFSLAGVPFVGAGVLGSAVGMDKAVMKRLLAEAGLPIVPHVTLRALEWERDRSAQLDAVLASLGDAMRASALFVKPANLGSSVGVSKVHDRASLERGIALAFEHDDKVIVEAGVVGVRELECAVLGTLASDPEGRGKPIASRVGEVVVTHPDGFYSYDAKYVDEHGATTVIPANLTADEEREVRALAVQTFEALECDHLARVDFFRGGDGKLYVNEINTMPGFTAISMYPKLFDASGIGAVELVSRLVDLALERAARRARLKT
ncbi:MAG: D-alanine--D-alanine ligase family protein [Polyangiaceae bacterium]